eukprot:UN10326
MKLKSKYQLLHSKSRIRNPKPMFYIPTLMFHVPKIFEPASHSIMNFYRATIGIAR